MRDCLPNALLGFIEGMDSSEWAVVELCDRAEFCFNMVYERMLGNQYAEIYYKRAWDKMTHVLETSRHHFIAKDDLVQGIADMRRNLDENWRRAKGVS